MKLLESQHICIVETQDIKTCAVFRARTRKLIRYFVVQSVDLVTSGRNKSVFLDYWRDASVMLVNTSCLCSGFQICLSIFTSLHRNRGDSGDSMSAPANNNAVCILKRTSIDKLHDTSLTMDLVSTLLDSNTPRGLTDCCA